MAEPQSIVLNKRNGGMSNDEYAGGSFFYGENINIRDNSKAFKLSSRVSPVIINHRSSGQHNKILYPLDGGEAIGLSNDGYIEGDTRHYDTASAQAAFGGYLYKRASGSYLNGTIAGGYLFAATTGKLDVFNIGTTTSYGYGLRGSELVTTPDLTANTGRTVGAGRATGAGGAVHTAGNTETLAQTITPGAGTGKISIYINAWTAGTLQVSYDGSVVGTLDITSGVPTAKRYTINVTTSASDAIVLTPSSTFDGTVKYVDVRMYDPAKIKADISLTTSTYKPMLAVGDFVYIGGGNKLEYIDTSIAFASRDALDALILQPGDDIFGLTIIGDIVNIYCNNGQDLIKYIWNRVDENPAEKIVWKNKKGISVDGDGNQDYVICGNLYKKMLYITNGYSKQLINQSKYMGNSGNYDAYRLENRFDFDKVIGFAGEIVYMGGNFGLYTYGAYNPGFPASTVKEWANNSSASMYYPLSMAYATRPTISYRTLTNTVNYNVIAKIRESSYNKVGYLVTNPLVFDNIGTEKLIRKLRIGYLLPSSTCSINIYARVNDRHYITFDVAGITVVPTVGAIYTNYNSNVFTVVKTNLTLSGTYSGTITCVAEYPSDPDGFSYGGALTKVSGTGDASITYTDRDNFVLVKTITTDKYKYANEYILGEDFIDIKMPEVVYKLQLKIELISTSYSYTPEIFDIPVLSDIVENEF